jgi:hypothetical protein
MAALLLGVSRPGQAGYVHVFQPRKSSMRSRSFLQRGRIANGFNFLPMAL